MYALFTALYKIVEDIGPSSACISVFAGLEGTKDDLQLPAANIWAFTRYTLYRPIKISKKCYIRIKPNWSIIYIEESQVIFFKYFYYSSFSEVVL